MHKSVVAYALLALVLSGCAGKLDAQRGLSEEWRLRSLEENFLNFKENQRQSEERGRDAQRKLVDRVRALELSVARLEGRQGLAPAGGRDYVGAKTAVAGSLAPTSGDMKARPAAKPAIVPADRLLYERGLGLVRTGKGPEGRDVLEKFLKEYPQSELVPNAIYWIGESRYGEKDYAKAILTFKDVTRRFPRHGKSAAALLKIAMSYRQMGENDNAVLYLRALLREHPKSEPAAAARKMLAELGG